VPQPESRRSRRSQQRPRRRWPTAIVFAVLATTTALALASPQGPEPAQTEDAPACGTEPQLASFARQAGHLPPAGGPPAGAPLDDVRLVQAIRTQAAFAERSAATGTFCPGLPGFLDAWTGLVDQRLRGGPQAPTIDAAA